MSDVILTEVLSELVLELKKKVCVMGCYVRCTVIFGAGRLTFYSS